MTINLNDKTFFYEDISRAVTDQIIDLASKGVDMFLEYEVWEYDIDIAENEYEKPIIKWVYNVARVPPEVFAESGRKYDITATAGYDECGELSILSIIHISEPTRHLSIGCLNVCPLKY